MDWLLRFLADEQSMATSLFVFALTIALGLLLGQIRFRGIQLGVAGVLFSGLMLGHWGWRVEARAMEFAREFGLVLFIYAVGLSAGPGFFNAFRQFGLKTNLFALGVVLIGTLIAVLASVVGGIAPAISAGLLSGATTNTPSLGAATQTLREASLASDSIIIALKQAGIATEGLSERQLLEELAKLPGLGYAITYPFGVVGIILGFLVLRIILRINPVQDARTMEQRYRQPTVRLERMMIEITKSNCVARIASELPELAQSTAVISRVWRGDKPVPSPAHAPLNLGDRILAVGPTPQLQRLRDFCGISVPTTPLESSDAVSARWVQLTRGKLIGLTPEQLHAGQDYEVQMTRIRRGETEIPPLGDLRLALGDSLLVVGSPSAIAAFAEVAGDHPKELEDPHLLSMFLGIGLGILLGSIPLPIPGLSTPLKIGLAGGPLLVALVLSHRQRVGPFLFHLPRSANLALKETGIALFLAAVGLKGGSRFVDTLIQGEGLWWLLWGGLITLTPLLVVGLFAAWWQKAHYTAIIGVLAGSTTDPPALAFAQNITQSEAPGIAYATVYPVAMILRVLLAQIFILVATR